MPGAAGAYAKKTGSIYINKNWAKYASKTEIEEVLTEELGHHLDNLLNKIDTKGDEGEAFAKMLLHKRTNIVDKDDNIQITIKEGILIDAEASELDGGAGDDTLIGANDKDVLRGLGGNDSIDGGDGNDTINGGEGNDTVRGQGGDDVIEGDAGEDSLDGGSGNDTVKDVGVSTIRGGDGNDTLGATATESGRAAGLVVYGDAGNDYIEGPTFKYVEGGSGDDTIQMSEGGAKYQQH